MKRSALPRTGAALLAICTAALAIGYHTSIARALSAPARPSSFTISSLPDYLQPDFNTRLASTAIRAGVNQGIDRRLSGEFASTRQQPNNTGSGTRPGQQTPRDLDITFVDNTSGNTGTAPTKAQLPPYSDIEPIYAPDRRTIAFSSNRPLTGTGPAGDFHLWTMLTDGSFQQPLAGTQGTDQEWPTYSPDGGRLAYSSHDAQGVTQLHVLDLGSGQDLQITSGPGEKTHPSWSHSDVIAFQSTETTFANPTGLPKIWLVEYTAGVSSPPSAQLTGIGSWDSANAGASDTEPAWEPNGAHVLFTRSMGGTQRIWIIAGLTFSPTAPTPAAAISVSQLTDFTANGVPSMDKDPAWRPEGPDYVNDFRTNPDDDAYAFASTRKSSPDPTQIENGAISVGNTYGIYRAPIVYQDLAQYKPLTESQAVKSGARPAVVVAEDTQHPPYRYDNQQPSWTQELHQDFITGQVAVANRIAYSSNSGISYSTPQTQFTAPLSVFDIWTSEIVDVTPPSLLSLPSVTPRFAAPGQPVTIKAQFNDLNAGIAHVYVQIKNPNSYLQDNSLPPVRAYDTTPHQIWPYQSLDTLNPPGLSSLTNTGHIVLDGHRIYYVYNNGGIPRTAPPSIISLVFSYVGIGFQPINPQTYSYKDGGLENLPFDVTDTVTGVAQFPNPDKQPPDTLEMSLSTDPADPPGTYTVDWTTDPNHATDYYLDFIAVDKVGNGLDYDDVWGFTTKQFAATGTQNNRILLVNDYMSAQEFEIPRASRDYDHFSVVPELVFDTESQFTDNPQGKGSALDPGRLNGGLGDALTALNYSLDPSATANPPNNFPIINQHNTLGPWSWVDEGGVSEPPFFGSVGIQREENYDQNRNFDGYDVWRILCRGPLSAAVLANYGPETVQEPGVPATTLVPRKVSYSAVLWGSSYTGDEYVGPGTILDNATQTLLTNFVSNGGRLMVTGQDVAFALTAGGALTNNSGATFLAQVFGVQYATDGQYDNPGLATVNGGPGPIYTPTTPFPILTTPTITYITEQPIYLPYTTDGIPFQINTTNADFAAIDQFFPDTVTPITTGLPTTVTVNMDLADGAADLTNTATGSQTVFWPCGAEGMDNDIREIPTPVEWENTSKRDRIVHAALCWLRQFRATGVINDVEPDGTIQAFGNALVEASVGGTVIAKALSAPDGSYVLNGLPTADINGPTVVVTAASPGYALSHSADGIQGHGDQTISGVNEFLAKLEPGTIMGQVTDAVTGAPIAGATVTVTNIPFASVTFTTTTDSNGNYVITGVPATPPANGVSATSYEVQVSANGYSSVTITGYGTNGTAPPPILVPSQGTVTVNASLVSAPGSISGTVVDPNNSLVSGATVTASPATAGASAVTATTDSQGVFTFTGLSADTYTLQATATGFGPSQKVTKPVAAGASITGITLQLTKGTGGGTGGGTTGGAGADSISGHVTVSSAGVSAPLSGLTVELFAGANAVTTGTPLQSVTTDASGLYTFTGLADGTYTVIVLAPGQSQTPTANVTVAAATNGGAATQDFTLSPLTVFPAGIIMISLPYNYSGTSVDAATILGLPGAGSSAPIATYDPTANQYLFYPNLPGGNGRQTQPGRGYWIKETSPMPFLTAGTPLASPFSETLAPGWNEIGDPFTTSVDWNLVQFSVPVAVGGNPPNTFITLQDALVNHIVGSPLYAYSVTQQQYVQTTTLQPFQGYWIYINPQGSMNQPVTLRFTKQG
ncbi:MAG TPA: carboxypeptidase regulatory-like domain-containing protein [Armatimonadota bacterium]|nr:carboxypeptidase regulatory-like domain-containing protein [Armatimonadota bacterium]